jgi:hypothetical protein
VDGQNVQGQNKQLLRTVQYTTLEAELVSSGRGEGDPGSVPLWPLRSLCPLHTALSCIVGVAGLVRACWAQFLVSPTGRGRFSWAGCGQRERAEMARGGDEREGATICKPV